MLKDAIQLLMQKKPLSEAHAYSATQALLTSENLSQKAAFLTLHHAMGETTDSLNGMLKALQEKRISITPPFPVMDLVGTGGDNAKTLNISTASSLLVAACDVPVLKHGNRAVSSKAGSADLLEAFGIQLALTPNQINNCLKKIGMAFCFAPHFHPLLKTLKPVRSALAVPTTCNLLGPLLNPGDPEYLLVGVYHEKYCELFATALQKRKVKRAFVVHGYGLDELSCLGPQEILDVTPESITKRIIDPKILGLRKCNLSDLAGGDPATNAKRLLQLFEGRDLPFKDTILLNAGTALFIFGKVNTIQEGVDFANKRLKEGRVLELLAKWKKLSSSLEETQNAILT